MKYSAHSPAAALSAGTSAHLAAALVVALAALGSAPSGHAADAAAPAHYVLDPAKSSLEFTFVQAGAQNKGRFKRFQVTLDFSPDNLAASRLDVLVEMTSVDTGDQERDDTVRGADLFNVAKFPQAHFAATQITRTAAGFEAVGKLTIRGVTRDERVPFSFRTATENGAPAGYMTGKTSLHRLDYGVGQGDWKATDQVGNDVGVSFALRLTAH
ncbi:MAG: YceI family protein [Gammaproteobacteria bacterium]|nr:YceI family protein [Gammaproteobacteria bacterium]MBV8306758.1 YceI family protein [Gammaproteobacteria bacterium]MBV8403624.1 YceI family protein [Gammaproteobacteria bacterium]